MIRKWDVDDRTLIEARIGMFGGTRLFVNGTPVEGKLTTRTKSERNFILPDGRPVSMSIKPRLGTRAELRLSVAGRLMVETGKKPFRCEGCGVVVKPNDRFCASCGREMPTGETRLHRDNLTGATRAIRWLAVLFLVSGLLVSYVQHQQAEKVLANIAHLDATANFPQPINGRSYTVGEVRERVAWEPRSTLIVNCILAAVMAALAGWGRRSPLPAILIATATFAVVTVTSAMFDPATIGQGIFVKIVVIALLLRGIKAALALRTADA